MKLSLRNAALAALLPLAVTALAGNSLTLGDPATIDRIVDEGKNHSHVMRFLTTLTQKIGPRLTSSPRLTKAENWGLSEFRKMGCTNVHLEKWGEAPVGWDRGGQQVARMVEPFQTDMVFTTPAWTNGTRGIQRGKVVRAPATPEEVAQSPDKYKGAWVLMAPPTGGGGGRPAGGPPGGGRPGGGAGRGAGAGAGGGAAAPPAGGQVAPSPVQLLRDALEKAGALGTITGSRNELVVTGGTWRDKTFANHPGIPQVTVRKSDYDRLSRNLDFGRNVAVEIGAENHWYKGPVAIHNVVAEIRGTEKPDEVVIVSGHLDSWNGPGSQGALDNGTGTCTALEAARILTRVGAKPKRTIRFILWTGEEEGLFGSTDYVKTHEAELPKISAVLVDDGGTNYQGGYQGLASQQALFEEAFAPSVKAFPEMPMKFVAVSGDRMPRGGGSDHAPFNRVGVPGFFTLETGRSDYNFVHHTQHDRLEMAIPEYLVQSATNHAVVAYNLACAPDMVPREPKQPAGN
ncbi:M28 family metallopeptidase [Fimbriimonas ginsengisoli]|uniref:Carboxypeptidase Q n=1 Tax=Fimbriimonas ginsengisoli Gsoil 348 TaxID=661478 RepID=A0A068NUY7_FIMGI|nr:M20/M25/M40 family metallo-hydrolase [Fimbriimonas ginsengisoli]AIE85414.1 Aminopeptidase [Fimbriimonas ginsengisoli Gsoil 348]